MQNFCNEETWRGFFSTKDQTKKPLCTSPRNRFPVRLLPRDHLLDTDMHSILLSSCVPRMYLQMVLYYLTKGDLISYK